MAEESKTETISYSCTKREKAAFRFLTSARGLSESEFARHTLVGDALAQFEEALRVLDGNGQADAKPAA